MKIKQSTIVIISIIFFIGLTFFLIARMWIVSIYEISGDRLGEVHFKVGDYKLGKQMGGYNICSKKEGCFNGEIKGLRQVGNDMYIYVESNSFNNFTFFYENGEVSYYMFRHSKEVDLKSIDDLPKFGYLSGDKVEFYSENDMENLSEEMQKIFREIEAYPTVIVNGVDYTRKVKSDESSSKCYSCEASF